MWPRTDQKELWKYLRIFYFDIRVFNRIHIFKLWKDTDICLLELTEDVIEGGKRNNVMLRTICLPEFESVPGSSCFTSGINQDSKEIDAVPLNLFSNDFCDNHSVYSHFQTSLNQNQLCAGLPSGNDKIAPFNGKYVEDFGGPLICLDKTNQKPIFTGVASSNSLSTKSGHPGMIQSFSRKVWVREDSIIWNFMWIR